jgi:hypothetical protein
MKVLIAGGSGFLGQRLSAYLAGRGDEVVVLSRRPDPARSGAGVREVAWSPGSDEAGGAADADWRRDLETSDAVVNLSGAGIADKRWTAARKRELLTSRTRPTRALVDAIRASARRPAAFIQGSGINCYGSTLDDTMFDESSRPADDFLGRTCVAWEAEARPLDALGCRLVFVRTSPVLDPAGGVLEQMARPFRFFVGGRVASGRQYMPWIHRDDWLALVAWAIDTPSVAGVLNATSPNPVTNAEFSRALARALRRPNWAPVPGVVLRLLFGELADALLITGARAVPARTQALGFEFRYPTLEAALAHLLVR